MLDLFGNEIIEDEPEQKNKGLSFFDCLKVLPRGAITPELANVYNPFMINKAFSQSGYTVGVANLMNELNCLPPEVQFNFYKLMKCSMGRTKWAKSNKDKLLEQMLEFYDLSKAKDMIYIFSVDALKTHIKELKKQKRNKNGNKYSK